MTSEELYGYIREMKEDARWRREEEERIKFLKKWNYDTRSPKYKEYNNG